MGKWSVACGEQLRSSSEPVLRPFGIECMNRFLVATRGRITEALVLRCESAPWQGKGIVAECRAQLRVKAAGGLLCVNVRWCCREQGRT